MDIAPTKCKACACGRSVLLKRDNDSSGCKVNQKSLNDAGLMLVHHGLVRTGFKVIHESVKRMERLPPEERVSIVDDRGAVAQAIKKQKQVVCALPSFSRVFEALQKREGLGRHRFGGFMH